MLERRSGRRRDDGRDLLIAQRRVDLRDVAWRDVHRDDPTRADRVGNHPPVAGVGDLPERQERHIDRRQRSQQREVVGGGIGVADVEHRRRAADQEADVLLGRPPRRVVTDPQHVHRAAADVHPLAVTRAGSTARRREAGSAGATARTRSTTSGDETSIARGLLERCAATASALKWSSCQCVIRIASTPAYGARAPSSDVRSAAGLVAYGGRPSRSGASIRKRRPGVGHEHSRVRDVTDVGRRLGARTPSSGTCGAPPGWSPLRRGAGDVPVRGAARPERPAARRHQVRGQRREQDNASRAPYSMRGAILPALAVVPLVNGTNPPGGPQTAARVGRAGEPRGTRRALRTWTLPRAVLEAWPVRAPVAPPPGQLVDVGGHRLHVWTRGEGPPPSCSKPASPRRR